MFPAVCSRRIRMPTKPGGRVSGISIRNRMRLPGDLVANSEFVTVGTLEKTSGHEGSVQLEVLSVKPQARSGLLAMGTTVGDAKGTWSSNNQVVSYAMPVVVNQNSQARKRV